mmetsp:Transcript_126414/g.219020  ORF Transcript_126414/g.219020 Transcript_126414/m.219020 type:complete len:200 (-) Transcript_126414:1198-1797(-)
MLLGTPKVTLTFLYLIPKGVSDSKSDVDSEGASSSSAAGESISSSATALFLFFLGCPDGTMDSVPVSSLSVTTILLLPFRPFLKTASGSTVTVSGSLATFLLHKLPFLKGRFSVALWTYCEFGCTGVTGPPVVCPVDTLRVKGWVGAVQVIPVSAGARPLPAKATASAVSRCVRVLTASRSSIGHRSDLVMGDSLVNSC